MINTKDQDQEAKIFIARQPIFDRRRSVYAYELLFRSNVSDHAKTTDDEYATMKVIANSLLIGLRKLTAGKRAFINFNRQLLLGKIPYLFPVDLLGIELLERLEPEKDIIEVCTRLKESEYLLVLDDFVFEEKFRPLIQLADIIKIDFTAANREGRRSIIHQVDLRHRELLAEKIETVADYKEAVALGYHYFQGFFFQKPDLLSSREMPGYKLNYLRILKNIHSPDLELNEIEKTIKHDVSLTYKLLRFINSAGFGFRVTIHSVHHALVLLGNREIKKWLTVIAMSGIGRDKPLELMKNSVIRARFCELIASELKLQRHQPSDFFLLGMFSLLDAFLDRPMSQILEDLPLEHDIKAALSGTSNLFKDVLDLVVMFEKANWETFTQSAAKLGLGGAQLARLYMESVEWEKTIPEEGTDA